MQARHSRATVDGIDWQAEGMGKLKGSSWIHLGTSLRSISDIGEEMLLGQ